MTEALQTATLYVDQQAIRTYAELTNDFNPIHLDAAFAAKTPMGSPIAHGTMSICLLWQALSRSFGARAFDELELDVKFVKPVRIGETLTAGGQPNAGDPSLLDVWVRADDGSERVAGTVSRR